MLPFSASLLLLFAFLIFQVFQCKTTIKNKNGSMILIPSGRFIMGSTNGEEDEKPVHEISVKSFFISKTEITQKEYEMITGKKPSYFVGDNLPVHDISWFDAIKYCNARSISEGREPCYNESNGNCNYSANGYRLPTEQEWEYACRAGTKGEYYDIVDKIGWCRVNSDSTPHDVALKQPNAFGLYDMCGNVTEYCNDWYLGSYKESTPEALDAHIQRAGTWYQKETHEQTEDERVTIVTRGGSWNADPSWMRSAKRDYTYPKSVNNLMGFRVVLTVK